MTRIAKIRIYLKLIWFPIIDRIDINQVGIKGKLGQLENC